MRMIVTAGGTGGHIYPALAIIGKFQQMDKDFEVLYIGTHNRMEKDIVPKRGIPYESIEIYGFSKTMIARDIKNIFLIRKATKKCEKIMREFRPDVVVAMGGYVTYPVMKAAHKYGAKTFIHEQNSIPGKSNLMLERYADIVGVSFSESKKYFKKAKKVVYTGNPCGEHALLEKPMSKLDLGLSKSKKLVIVVAGSLGSESLNDKMKSFLHHIGKESYEVLYITGKDFYEDFTKGEVFPSNVKVIPYLDRLSALMKRADLIVTRAGASTISEILALRLPAIFIPSPYVANNHQYYNALSIKNKKAGELILEKDLTAELLQKTIHDILLHEDIYQTYKKNLESLSSVASSDIIYEEIKGVLRNG